MKNHLSIILLIGINISLYSQTNYDKNWVIGYSVLKKGNTVNGAMMVFNKDSLSIIPIEKTIELGQSTVALSDKSGKLQFYSNGCSINNNMHKTIEKGDSIGKGNYEKSYCYPKESGKIPLTQMLFAVPNLVQNKIYYLFNLNLESDIYKNGQGFPLSPTELYLNEVDMSDNIGKTTKKLQVIVKDTFARAMLQGVIHKNKKDWWIIMPKSQSNCYYVIKIDDKGNITTTKQCEGFKWSDIDVDGQAIFSPNRKFYVRLGNRNRLNIFDFDNETGKLKSKYTVSIQDTFYTSGVAFSSNSRYLYAMCGLKLYQYDMKAVDFEKSRILIDVFVKSPKSAYSIPFGQSMLAPDGKIYIAGAATHDYLHVIHQPNKKGKDCVFEQYAIPLPCFNAYGLPNMPHFKDWQEDTTTVTTTEERSEPSNNIKIYPNPANDFISFEIENIQFQKGNFFIFNSFGKNILTHDFSPNNGKYYLDISNFKNGIYFLQLFLDDKMVKKDKIVILKQ